MNITLEIKREGRTPSRIAIDDVRTSLPGLLEGRDPIVITDENIESLYPELLSPYRRITIGRGEECKTLDTVTLIYRRLMDMGADRSSYLLGIGGGIVTDITGFVASTYMRGTGFGFVATTLLSQVDASVGGKNGVNVDGYKNMAGCFNQPDFVVCDPSMLRTLPEREIKGGMAEVIKAGLIKSAGLFDKMEAGYDAVMNDAALLSDIIGEAIKIKAAVVEADFKEGGERKKLNFGHTIAHAIEKLSRRYIHGEAVAIGCVYEAELCRRLGAIGADDAARITAAIERLGLPTKCDIDDKSLFEALHLDKKRHGDKIALVILDSIGTSRVEEIGFGHLAELMEIR